MSTRALHGLLSAIGILFFLLSLTNARPVIEERTVGRRPCVNDTNLPPAVRSVCPGGTSPASITNTTVLPSGVSMTTGVCHHDGGDQWEPATVDLAAVVDSASCPIAPNDCVSRFGTANQGQGFVGECGAPCSSVRHFYARLFDHATHKCDDSRATKAPVDPILMTVSTLPMLFSPRVRNCSYSILLISYSYPTIHVGPEYKTKSPLLRSRVVLRP
jgi:hypothetical protein